MILEISSVWTQNILSKHKKIPKCIFYHMAVTVCYRVSDWKAWTSQPITNYEQTGTVLTKIEQKYHHHCKLKLPFFFHCGQTEFGRLYNVCGSSENLLNSGRLLQNSRELASLLLLHEQQCRPRSAGKSMPSDPDLHCSPLALNRSPDS
jgi:hypothetical protein